MSPKNYINSRLVHRQFSIFRNSHMSQSDNHITFLLVLENIADVLTVLRYIILFKEPFVLFIEDAKPVLTGDPIDPNFDSELFNNKIGYSVPQDFLSVTVPDITEQPFKITGFS